MLLFTDAVDVDIWMLDLVWLVFREDVCRDEAKI